jgi:hypothetical protein
MSLSFLETQQDCPFLFAHGLPLLALISQSEIIVGHPSAQTEMSVTLCHVLTDGANAIVHRAARAE